MKIPAAGLKGSDPPLTARGDARFWRICVALFLGGFGLILARAGWAGVAAFVGALAVLALLVALRLARVPPPAHLRPK